MIKLADFGLSEDVFMRNYFRQDKEQDGVKLPVRWMAIESLNDGIFTEKTDVVCIHNYLLLSLMAFMNMYMQHIC